MKLFFQTALALLFTTTLQAAPMQTITRADTLNFTQAPAAHFSGTAQFARLPVMPSQGDVAPAIVEFAPGAITDWHIHPNGQYLLVTEGEGRMQEWDKPVQIIKKGDSVWCPPGVKHWHGAGEHTAMSHIAISPVDKDKPVIWLEKVALPDSQTQAAAPLLARQQGPLSAKQLAIVPIAALSASGDLAQLKAAIISGLDNGLTISEIQEIFTHQYAYAGFPRALNGLLTLQAVVKERSEQGIQDHLGLPDSGGENIDYYRLGQNQLSDLSGRNGSDILFNAPGIDYALKAHLFGYLFSRQQLSAPNRQLVTVSTLAALGNVNPQLASHLRNTQNLGVDKAQLERVAAVLEQNVSPAIADNMRKVLNESR